MNTRNKATGLVIAGTALLALLTYDEGTRYKPYRDIGGVWTVCQGHTGPDVIPGKTYTKEDCDKLLVKDATAHGAAVLRCSKVPLNQNQYEAFTRFTFNLGPRVFCNSDVSRKLNAGDYQGACKEMLRYRGICHKKDAKGKCVPGHFEVIRGLQNRRKSEYQQCITPIPQETITEGIA